MNITKQFNKLNKNNSLLIVPNNIKEKVIKLKTEEEIKRGTIYQFKVLSFSEFINMSTFNAKNDIYLLDEPISSIKEKIKFSQYNLKNENEYLKMFIEENKSLINVNKTFISNLDKYSFFVIGPDVYLKPIFDFYNLSYERFKMKNDQKDLKVKKFLNKTEEVFYLFEDISKRLKSGADINKIYIANADESYYGEFVKHSTFYNIPIDFNLPVRLFDISFIKELLSLDYDSLIMLLSDTDRLSEKYQYIKKINSLYFDNLINELINIVNKYSNNYNKERLMEVIKDDAKNKIIKESYNEAIKFIEVDEILTLKEDDVVYIINARYEEFPKIVKNNDFLRDLDKDLINYPNSSLVNEAYNNYYEEIVKSNNICYLSYPTKDKYLEYEPSDIVSKHLDKKEDYTKIKLSEVKNGFAKEYYKQKFSSKDNDLLLTSFTGKFKINSTEQELLINYLKSLDIKLSPSLITSYLRVPFIYYVERILKVSTFKESISLYIGNFFHTLVEVMLTIKFSELIEVKDNYHRDETLNKAIINYLNHNINDPDIDYDLYFAEFFTLYFDNLFKTLNNLEIQTLFFIKKNQEIFIDSLKLLVDKNLSEKIKEIYIEKEISLDNVYSKADLIQVYQDNSFSVTDYKTGGRPAYFVERVAELLNDLLNDNDINLTDMDLIQPLFYALYFQKLNNNYSFRDVSFYSFFNEKAKLNSLMINELDGNFYTRGKKRLVTKEKLLEINQNLESIFEKVLKNILNANFKVEVIKDKNNKLNLEKEWFGIYEAVAFFYKNDFEEENEEELFD